MSSSVGVSSVGSLLVRAAPSRARGGALSRRRKDDGWIVFRRNYSSSPITPFAGSERMRVAIIGGGPSGLSTALHLAPLASAGLISSPIDIFEESPKQAKTARSIGVGIWSTALEPFRVSDRPSHQLVWQKMTNQGSWIDQVGYRTPNGDWLVHSRLATKHHDTTTTNTNDEEEEDKHTPGLLFLRESDFHATLRMAVAAEELNHTIRVHANTPVKSLHEQSPHAWSAPLLLQDGTITERDYHLIVAADGIHSRLRKAYGGRRRRERRLTGASAFPTTPNHSTSQLKSSWEEHSHGETTQLEDRQYNVFRGNAPSDNNNIHNFQTWGEGKSMRFATVHMTHPAKDGTRHDKQVWFITTDDTTILQEQDPVQRKKLLLDAFADWHDPIGQMVASTPAEEILAERAMAHRHSIGPVDDMNEVLKRINKKRPPSSGRGPAMVFIGDAFMTVDPILAQGFSVGMEAAADLPASVAASCQPFQDKELLFDPYKLRSELMTRHERRLDRLVCLLRATEIVQALGQPRDGTMSGFLAKHVLRPLMKMAPNFVKTPFFNAMLTYSLGLGLSGNKKTIHPNNDK
ncbi:expressed unknown protein [Seminavis robusta]|uniref:Uncharacterized protein n=1 Tax=Seminavis robusta TaxID=568900 RepID=A0A9N8HA19_9STRA|nr:expressed unknown protein [Seminavis robusta]|eukprot:Sro133_g063180.1 n/a (575) ;mRNA; f:87021-89059